MNNNITFINAIKHLTEMGYSWTLIVRPANTDSKYMINIVENGTHHDIFANSFEVLALKVMGVCHYFNNPKVIINVEQAIKLFSTYSEYGYKLCLESREPNFVSYGLNHVDLDNPPVVRQECHISALEDVLIDMANFMYYHWSVNRFLLTENE